jgi:hypothetical protein
MANLILRQVKGSALTIEELDGNFEYFTGSYTNTGIITAVGFSGSFTGSVASASYATQALSSSYSLTATSASYATNANNALTATSASYATNANNALTASYINPLEQDAIITGSLIINGGFMANSLTNSINLTIPSGYNASLVGPIYNSASINVPLGSRLIIL